MFPLVALRPDPGSRFPLMGHDDHIQAHHIQ